MTGRAAENALRFGTAGWRALIADGFTTATAAAVVESLAEQLPGPVLVAYDTRFLAERFARGATARLLALGHAATLTPGPRPTPLLSWAVRERRAGFALVVTASHNPAEYLGFKVFDGRGRLLDDGTAREVERGARERLLRGTPPLDLDADAPIGADPLPEWAERGRSLFAARLGGAHVPILVDAHFGAGQWGLPQGLAALGLPVTLVGGGINPAFPGRDTDPTRAPATRLVDATRAAGAALGVALDVDADRFAVCTPDGPLHAVDAQALALDTLLRDGERGLVVTTAPTAGLLSAVVDAARLPHSEVTVGWKRVGPALDEAGDGALLGADESGGFALAALQPGKDPLPLVALLARVAAEGGVEKRLAALRERHGSWVYARLETRGGAPEAARIAAVLGAGPHPAGFLRERDGVRLLVRAAGTEGLVRGYVTARDLGALEALRRAWDETVSGPGGRV